MKKLRVMADPINGGRHPYHDSRWVVTQDARVEHDNDPISWYLSSGSLICQMRDCIDMEKYANLFAAAPELLEALENLDNAINEPSLEIDIVEASNQARKAIAKAKGEST